MDSYVDDLVIDGFFGADYSDSVAAVSYDAAGHVVTWSLSTPLVADRLGLSLSSDLVVAQDGGSFSQVMNVLPGDVNRSFSVDTRDIQAMRSVFLASVGEADYNANADIDGSGTVDIRDLQQLRQNLLTGLPQPRAASEANWPTAVDAAFDDLFGE